MSSTVLEIGNAAAEIVGLPQQGLLVGNTNQNAKRILNAVRNGGRDTFRGFDWAACAREHTFTTDASSSYSLPTYFDRIFNNTIWDRTNYRQLIGPLSRVEWQKHKSGIVNLSGIFKVCRIGSDDTGTKVLEIIPTTDTGTDIAFDYIDSRYVIASGGDLRAEGVTADDDEFLFDSEVVEAAAVWRLLRMLGLSYEGEIREWQQLMNERGANDAGGSVVNMRLRAVFRGFDPHIPDTGYGS